MKMLLTPRLSLGELTTNKVRLVLSRELFERLSLGLGDQEGRENARQHEESEDLKNAIYESVCTTDITKTSETNLSNNSSKFTGSGRDTVRCRTVTSGEGLSGNDESRGVGAEVLEEVGQAVEEDESLLSSIGGGEPVVSETHGDESASEHTKTEKLDRLASPRVDENEGDPVSGDEAGDSEDQVTDGDIFQVVVDLEISGGSWGSETDGGQDDGRVKSKTIESNIESKPRPGSSEQNLSVLPLTEVSAEVSPTGLGDVDLGGDNAIIGTVLNTLPVTLDIPDSLLHVTLDIEGETGGLWDGETEVKSDNTRNASEADKETPAVVNSRGGVCKDVVLVGTDDDEGDEGGSKVTKTLSSEGSSHHATTDASRSKFGRDDSREWVITTDTDAHDEPPDDENTDDVNGRSVTRKGLSKGSNDDDHEFDTVHLLTADNISKPTEQKLSDQGANGGGDFDTKILVGIEFSTGAIDVTQHNGGDVDSEDVVCIGEEADSSGQADFDMEP